MQGRVAKCYGRRAAGAHGVSGPKLRGVVVAQCGAGRPLVLREGWTMQGKKVRRGIDMSALRPPLPTSRSQSMPTGLPGREAAGMRVEAIREDTSCIVVLLPTQGSKKES